MFRTGSLSLIQLPQTPFKFNHFLHSPWVRFHKTTFTSGHKFPFQSGSSAGYGYHVGEDHFALHVPFTEWHFGAIDRYKEGNICEVRKATKKNPPEKYDRTSVHAPLLKTGTVKISGIRWLSPGCSWYHSQLLTLKLIS